MRTIDRVCGAIEIVDQAALPGATRLLKLSTVDLSMPSGAEVEIEDRGVAEVVDAGTDAVTAPAAAPGRTPA